MNLEKVKKLRKGLVIALVAGVIVSQAAPAIHSGTRATADTDGTETTADDILEQEAALQAAEAAAAAEPAPAPAVESEPAAESSDDGGSSDSSQSGAETTESADTGDEGGQNDPGSQEGQGDQGVQDGQEGQGDGQEGPGQTTDDPTLTDGGQTTDDPAAPGNTEDSGQTDTQTPEKPAAQTDIGDQTEQPPEDVQQTVVPPEGDGSDIIDSEQAEELSQSDDPSTQAFYEQAAPRIAENEARRAEAEAGGGTYYPVPSGRLVPSPVIYQGFRFWTVAPDYAFASDDIKILEEKNGSSRAIGTLEKDGMCYVLKTEQDGWYYVESGDVRGFVQKDDIMIGLGAQEMLDGYQTYAENAHLDLESVAPIAESLVNKDDNAAYDYYRATVYQTVVKKDYALPADGAVDILEEANADGRVVGTLAADGLAYVIADKDSDWVYVESGDVRGFVQSDKLTMLPDDATAEAADEFLEKEENDYPTASIVVEPHENEALYYTITSIRSGVPDGMERSSILQYAAEFIGNPYVWGGTSLTNGADCSGFVQSIFAQYGYNLPRTAAEQSQVGTQIPVKDAQPGDLIFYGNGNSIYHVVIYAGEGTTIEAKSTKYGIVAAKVNYGAAVWATRIIDEDQAVRYDIPEGLGDIHTYMGWQKVTMQGSQQYAFREAAGMAFDPEGFAVVDNRYVIACTTTFGNIGDYIDFYQADGSVIPCIIGDFKNQNDAACNVYGHLDGDCIVEFVVDMNSWYPSHANPGTSSCHPEWDQDIVKAENVGSFYD